MIIFRAACSHTIGTGHLFRSLTLAQELTKRDIPVSVVSDDNPLAREVAKRHDVNLLFVACYVLLPRTLSFLSTLVLDSPPGSDTFLDVRSNVNQLSLLNDSGVNIVTIGHATHNAKFLRAVIDLYPHREVHAANYHEGSDYLILRREFEHDPGVHEPENSVLISMGGSDPHDLTQRALNSLKWKGFSGNAIVVLGAGYSETREQKMRQEIQKFNFHINIKRNVKNMRSLMRNAYLGIAAFGTTAYEMMSQRLPAVVYTHYKWQESSARFFEELGCCVYLGCAEDGIDDERAGETMDILMSDKHKIQDIVNKSRTAVDGKGAKRVADMLEQMTVGKDDQRLDILFILAHPGDELFGCGGTLIKHIRKGKRVGIVILGEGVSSRQNETQTPEKILTARKEIKSSLQAVIDEIHLKTWYYYRFKDNRFDTHDLLDIIKVIETIFARHQPDTVYTHHPGDLNIDHRRTFEAVITAARPDVKQTIRKVLSVEVPSSSDWGGQLLKNPFQPNWFVDISDVLDEKAKLLTHYTSELRDDPHPRSIPGIMDRARQWGRVTGRQYAEAFVLQRGIYE